MAHIRNILFLLLFCGCLILMEFTPSALILWLLSGSFSFFGHAFPAHRCILFLGIVVFGVLSCFFPVLFCLLPLFLYDACRFPKWLPIWFFILSLRHLMSHSPLTIFLTGLGCFAAVLLFVQNQRLLELEQVLHHTRDQLIAQNRHLGSQNRVLSQTQSEAVSVAILTERNRIAREIHDNVGHLLTRSILQLGAVQVINQADHLKAPLSDLRETLDTAMTSIRSSVHDLHDDAIHLQRAAEACIRTLPKRFQVHLDFDASETMPKEVKSCFLGILRESISNIIKHSNGDTVTIVCREHPAFYQLSILDNGNSGKVEPTGIGLYNMQKRADYVHGIFYAEPTREGFRVFLTVAKMDGKVKIMGQQKGDG